MTEFIQTEDFVGKVFFGGGDEVEKYEGSRSVFMGVSATNYITLINYRNIDYCLWLIICWVTKHCEEVQKRRWDG